MSKSPVVIEQPFQMVLISKISRNPEQPRKHFDQEELEGLASSIREHGVIEPVILEVCGSDYILHDGERRWLASKLAGLNVIPAIVTPPLNGTGPRERLERALVANVQRSDMHPIEEGYAYRRLIQEFKLGIGDVVKRTGKAYTRIYTCLELLNLDEPIQQLMLERKLPSAAKVVTALLSIESKEERVAMAQALAERKATATMIVAAVAKYNRAKKPVKKSKRGSPAFSVVEKGRPEWDALYQLGRVPPWQVITDAVMATCDECPLRAMASDATCRDCALVVSLQKMMSAVKQ